MVGCGFFLNLLVKKMKSSSAVITILISHEHEASSWGTLPGMVLPP
jgi:hypothetical protein